MANYYTQFSSVLELISEEEKIWCETRLEELSRTREGDNTPIPEEGAGFDGEGEIERYESQADFEADIETDRKKNARCVWFHGSESDNIDHIAAFVQEYLAKFHPDQCWSMEWANTCDGERVDSFSGGAVFVTAKKTTFMNTGRWCEEQARAFKKRRKNG